MLITNCQEAIYAFNNCIFAFGLEDAEVQGVVRPELRLDPKSVIAYQCDSETEEPTCISDPNTGRIDEKPLGQYGEQLQTELNRIFSAIASRELEALNKTKPPPIKNTSKRGQRIKVTSKVEPRIDPDKVATALGAKRVGKSPERSTMTILAEPPQRKAKQP